MRRVIMLIFLCRWPDGNFSIVAARNNDEVLIQLAEFSKDFFGEKRFAALKAVEISPMPSCMLHFELVPPDIVTKKVEYFRIGGFGQETWDFIIKEAYPKLNEAIAAALKIDDPEAVWKLWAEAMLTEMNRLRSQAIGASMSPNSTHKVH